MQTVGKYEILDDLYLTEQGSISRARRADGERGLFVIKRFACPIEDPSEPHWELQTFLDRARVQQVLAAGGAKHWAAIHDMGIDAAGAYYVTDYHPLSIRKLIDNGVALKSGALHAIVVGVTRGLTEIKAIRNRAHGNLRPGNVVISGRDLATAEILLTDPASNAQAAKCGENGDLVALGNLIHEVVLHRPAKAGEWPLPPAPEWGALGAKAEQWRKLCNDLLNPEVAARPKLPALAQRLHGLRSRRRLHLRKFFATAAVLAILAAVGVAVLSVLDHNARGKFQQARRDWLGKFEASVSDPDRRQRWQADPDLRQILARIPTAQFREIESDSPRLIRWRFSDLKEIYDANIAVQRLQEDLTTLKLPTHAEELRQRLEGRGWSQPAKFLGDLVEAARPAPGADVAAAIDALLVAVPNAETGLEQTEADWKKLNQQIVMIEGANDPMLTALAATLKNSVASDVRLGRGIGVRAYSLQFLGGASSTIGILRGFPGLGEVKRSTELAEELTTILVTTYPVHVDREALQADVAETMDIDHLERDDVERWRSLVEYHKYLAKERHFRLFWSLVLRIPTEQPAAADDLHQRLADMRDRVKGGDNRDEDEFNVAKRTVDDVITNFELAKFTRRTLDDGTFSDEVNGIRGQIAALGKFYHEPLSPEEWLKKLPPLATDSNEINRTWDAWKTAVGGELAKMSEKDRRVEFPKKRASTEQFLTLLKSLDNEFPTVPSIPSRDFMKVGQDRREKALEGLLRLIDLDSPALPREALKVSVDDFRAWVANLVALSKDFPINKQIIGPNDRVDEKWKQKPDFWKDQAIQSLVKDDVARLGRITAMDNASRQELAKVISEGGDAEIAEVALAAWRRLGSDAITPAWPNNNSELTVEMTFRQRLATALKSLKNSTEAEGPTRELGEQGPIRWRRYVETSTSELMLQSAWNVATSFGIDAAEMAKLTPVARYNLYLACLNDAIVLGDEKAVSTDLEALSSAAAALKDHPELATLAAQIAKVAAKEPYADQATGDLFELTIPGSTRPLQFKRVQPLGARAAYLCTTHVSVGQFIAAMNATHAWPQARRLAWPYAQGKSDTRRGPRTWEWGGTTESPMTVPQLWLAPEGDNDFPPSFRATKFNRMALSDAVGGLPTGDHPMQYVSAEVALYYAALCGCRLPTPAEWEVAYEKFEKTIPVEQWNLRDQTWEVQRSYVTANGGTCWPDEGIFSYGIDTSAARRAATSRPGNDGTLFFQSVDAPRGHVFHHLVGNVGQFVCDAPEAFNALRERDTSAGIRKFLEQSPKSIYVIGGSALSPPEVAYDKPLPVERCQDAYADIGIRLAFTAPSRTLAERVKWVIGQPPYLWPKRVAKAENPN